MVAEPNGPGGEMTVVDQLGPLKAMSPVNPLPDGDLSWTSLPTATEKDRAATLRYRRRVERASDDALFAELQLMHVYIHQVQLVNEETGEVDDAIRTVLIAPDGTATQFVSGGIFQSLRDIIAVFGPPPWAPPIVVKVCQTSTRKKRRLLHLEPCGRVATELP